MTQTESAPAAGPGRLTAARRRLEAGGGDRLAWAVLALLLIVAAAVLLHLTRGTTLWFDEWDWALGRRANDLDAFLRPHNEHLSLFPIAIYRLLFATAGFEHYGVYRAVVALGHLLLVAGLFAYVRRRVGNALALGAATLLLFFGPGWQDILWPFQIGYQLSLLGGLVALLALDRRDRVGDMLACAALVVAVGSSGVGVPILLGAAVELALTRRGRRAIWIVAVPLGLYAAWWIVYQQDTHFTPRVILQVPEYVAAAFAAATSSVAGLSGGFHAVDHGSALEWGRPLAVVAAGLLGWALARRRAVPPRVATLIVILLAFWVLTVLSRGPFGSRYTSPDGSRYLYVGAVFGLLLAAELLRGVPIRRTAAVLLAVGLLAAVVSNLGVLRDSARYLRSQAQVTRSVLAAIDISRDVVAPDYRSDLFFGSIVAGPYLAERHFDGSPADSATALTAEPPDVRDRADAELVRTERIALTPAVGPPAGARPAAHGAAGGTLRPSRRSCVAFRPTAVRQAGAAPLATFGLPDAGLQITARGGPVDVSIRRFGVRGRPLGSVAAGARVMLRAPKDRAAPAWIVGVAPGASALLCGA